MQLIKKITMLFIPLLALISCNGNGSMPNGKMLLTEDWTIQSSAKVNGTGADISGEQFQTGEWYNTAIPTTVMGALVSNGMYEGVLEGINYKSIDRTPFDDSWWFRKEFDIPALGKDQYARLNFDGLSFSANVWLNGTQIASKDECYGPFRQFSFDVTSYLAEKNVLAVEVFRAQAGDPNIGFVDWNPRPADESMGIYREVYLDVTEKVELRNPYVRSKVNTTTLDEAWLAVEVQLVNHSDKAVKGKLTGRFEDRNFSVSVELNPGEEKTVKLTSEEVPELHVKNPRIWWSADLGSPEMYQMDLEFQTGGKISDAEQVPFGIREIKDYFTKEGHRGFILNGKNVLIKSAGWTDDIFLRDTPQTNEIQVQYVKDMNMNSIRFENVWGTSQNIYDMCDKYGLLALVGWSCQWEWEVYLGSSTDKYGGIITDRQIELTAASLKDQVLWLRNHPSIIAWYVGSDMLPRPELEKKYLEILDEIDDRPYVASAKGLQSTLSGPTGMKMVGPYEYVGPSYWYEDTSNGGAYGFNTETGIGAQLPVIESIRRMIPEDKLWPLNEYWDYHCTTAPTDMNSMRVLNEAIEGKYGKAANLTDFLRKADLLNSEGTKAMFEAFRVNVPKSTGIVQWMLNSAWPSLYWQLYDHYLIPTAAYYSVKKGNAPQQLIYNYKDNSIYYVSNIVEPMEGRAKVSLYGDNSSLLQEADFKFRVESDCSKKIFDLDPIAGNVFLIMQLYDANDKLIADNFYCLSGKKDIHDWEKTTWINTPMKSYADFKALEKLPFVDLEVVEYSIELPEGNDQAQAKVILKNPTPGISLMTRLALKDTNGNIIYPAFWSDNYIAIMPGESREVQCLFPKSKADACILSLSGWNVKERELSRDESR